MCKKYINSNVHCFNAVNSNILGGIGFAPILSSVNAKNKDGTFIIGGFDIVVFLNIRGTKDGNNSQNPVDAGKKLYFKVRLTKLDGALDNQLSYDIKDFEIDLAKEKKHESCFKYVESIKVIHVDEIVLNEMGSYTIKVLVKESEDPEELYDVQMTHNLYVKFKS